MLYFFFWVIPPALNFLCQHFGTFYIFIGNLNKKNNLGKMDAVFIQAKVWQKKGGPVRRRRDEERCDQAEEQGVEHHGPNWRPVVKQGCGVERTLSQSKEGES
jgi:hypothetical protein